MTLKEWTKLPSRWIEEKRLRELRWASGQGANNVAALMVLLVIVNHANDTGRTEITYDALATATGLSRAKISAGLSVLQAMGLIKRDERRSGYILCDYDPKANWAKLPARLLYTNGRIAAFDDFKLRRPAELHALKLYFLFASRRDRLTNFANISFNKITEYSGVEQHAIKRAVSILLHNGLLYVERQRSWIRAESVSNAYRLVGLETRNHLGTQPHDFEEEIGAATTVPAMHSADANA
jgi:DNA-binding transcriptional ArsR family regulator